MIILDRAVPQPTITDAPIASAVGTRRHLAPEKRSAQRRKRHRAAASAPALALRAASVQVHLIEQATSRDVAELCELLRDAVHQGASVGYVLPLQEADVDTYWRGVLSDVASGAVALLALRVEGGIVGTVQLAYAMKPNGRHRAEVQKMLVHSTHRRKGYGRVLMQAVEDTARRAGRSVLVLDTETGSAGQKLYAAMGWTAAGAIPEFALATSGDGRVATTYMYKLLRP